jgi:1,4-dihydroxy-2-naphthoate polyprenyltransferase
MSMRVWIDASRPKTLWAAVSPVFIGVAMSYRDMEFRLLPAILALVSATLIQVATNFYNDYADFRNGADTGSRAGPERAVQSGQISASTMRKAAYSTFFAAALAGVYLMIRGGWPIVLIGFSSILFGIMYTRGRNSLSYLGIADVFVFVFFGPVAVAGTYYVQALSWPAEVWVAGIAPGLLSVAILMVNNIRDIETDRAAGKHTLVVRLGRRNGIAAWAGCLLGAALVPLGLSLYMDGSSSALIAILVLIPATVPFRTLLRVPRTSPVLLNPALGSTARLLLIYSVLFSIGWNIPG